MGAGTLGPHVGNCSGREGDISSRKGMQRKRVVSEEVLIKYNKHNRMETAQWAKQEVQLASMSVDSKLASQAEQHTFVTSVLQRSSRGWVEGGGGINSTPRPV